MVAISLYRGNLHRVPDVPRQWLMPRHPISVKHFKTLLSRRTRSLPRHLHTNPNTNPSSIPQQSNPIESQNDDVIAPPVLGSEKDEVGGVEEVRDARVEKLDGGDWFEQAVDGSGSGPVVVANDGDGPVDGIGNLEVVVKEEMTSAQIDALNEKEKRKKEVEEKLQVLNAQKHNLVQVLKQILNVEEELKRRNSIPALATTRPSVPVQGDVPNDSGLMTRHGTPKMGLEVNLGGYIEGAEAEDVSNHNMPSRRLGRMSSTSPTSDSPFRRSGYPQHNVGPHPSRATLGAAGSPSPSRFAPMGHPQIMPTVSVSGTGTNYIASSPSPAASGGTSVFRDAHHPSPWN